MLKIECVFWKKFILIIFLICLTLLNILFIIISLLDNLPLVALASILPITYFIKIVKSLFSDSFDTLIIDKYKKTCCIRKNNNIVEKIFFPNISYISLKSGSCGIYKLHISCIVIKTKSGKFYKANNIYFNFNYIEDEYIKELNKHLPSEIFKDIEENIFYQPRWNYLDLTNTYSKNNKFIYFLVIAYLLIFLLSTNNNSVFNNNIFTDIKLILSILLLLIYMFTIK